MNKIGRALAALALCGFAAGAAGVIWKALDYRDRLHAITDNSKWEAHLRQAGVYTDRRIVFFGDSQIANWPMAESFGVMPIINRGIVGDWASKAVSRFATDVLSQHPDTLVILIGTNDLGNHQPLESIISSIDRMVQAASGINVVICSLLPVRGEYLPNHSTADIQTINERLKALSIARGTRFVDLYTPLAEPDGTIQPALTVDGLHANLQGYTRMTMALRGAL